MTPLPFFEYSLYEMYLLFIIWGFLGWCIEVCYMTIETGEYQNRGFLNGPICPIYGFGVLMIATFFRPINDTFILLFLCSGLLCTAFELSVGLLMEAVFHNRWWDYSHEHFNYKGLICLKVSILWGLGCVFVIRIVHPLFEKLVDVVPFEVGISVIVIVSVLIIIDIIASVKAVNKLNDRLKQIDAISKKMLSISVAIGGVLAGKTNDVLEDYDKLKQKTAAAAEKITDKVEEAKEASAEKTAALTAEYNELKQKYETLLSSNGISNRLIKAFPTLKNKKYTEALRALKYRISPKSAEHFELRLDEVKKHTKSKRR